LEASLLACLSGMLYLVYILFYFAAMSRSDAVVVVALGQITPVFSTLWGYFILGEVFGAASYAGVILVVLGAVVISVESRPGATQPSPRLNAALPLMVAACVIHSLSDLLLKYPLAELNTWSGFFWPRVGIFAAALVAVACCSIYRRLWPALKNMGWGINGLILGSEAVALAGILAITLAYDLGPLTLISALGSTQPLFILLLIGAINWIKKEAIPGRANCNLFLMRLLPMSLIISGVYLLSEG
jgi:drug/metabolite transporter (DMT)-like permease